MRSFQRSFLLGIAVVVAISSARSQTCRQVCDIDPTGSSRPGGITACFGNTLVFGADNGTLGIEPWAYDVGTGQCTLIGDIMPGAGSSISFAADYQFTCCGDKVYFRAVGTNGVELFEWDGTNVVEHDLRPGAASSVPDFLTSCANKLFFNAHTDANGGELWVADPVSGSVTMLEIRPGPGTGVSVPWITCVKDKVYFGGDGTNGNGIYVSDGTQAGTMFAGAPNAFPDFITYCPDSAGNFRLFFTGLDAGSSRLLVWDGTTVTVLGPPAASPGPAPTKLTCCGDKVYYATVGFPGGDEPWVSDGTPAGTFQLADIYPGSGHSDPFEFTCCGDQVFFNAADDTSATGTGRELYVTDGTRAGTQLVEDIRPGSAPSSAGVFKCVGDKVYFAADDGTAGGELWVSDGTAAGTQIVRDINPGATGSVPASLTCCAGDLYFSANGGQNGVELWVLEKPSPMAETLGTGCRGASMRSTLPVLGGSTTLSGECAPAGHIGVIAVGVQLSRPAHTPFLHAPGCMSWLDLRALFVLQTVNTTRWSTLVGVPGDAALNGAGVAVQTWYLDTSTAFPAVTTNGLLWTIGM